MTVNLVVMFVIALIILAIGIYIIYTKILKPSETTTSILSCESRGGVVATSLDCSDRKSEGCSLCIKLPNKDSKGEPQPCCIKDPFK